MTKPTFGYGTADRVDMNRALQLWLFTTTLTLLAIGALIAVALLSMAYLPAGLVPMFL